MIVLGAIHHARIGLDVLTILVKHVKHELGALDTSFRRFVEECKWDDPPSEDAHPPADASHSESASSSTPDSDNPTTTAAPAVPSETTTARAQASVVLEGGR